MMRGVEFAFYFILYSLLCNAYSMQFWKEILQYNSTKPVIGRLHLFLLKKIRNNLFTPMCYNKGFIKFG